MIIIFRTNSVGSCIETIKTIKKNCNQKKIKPTIKKILSLEIILTYPTFAMTPL